MPLPEYLKMRDARKKGEQDLPLYPANILVDDIEKVVIKRDPHHLKSIHAYLISPFSESHHTE